MEKTFEEKFAEAKSAVTSVSPQEAKKRQQIDANIIFVDPRAPEDITSTTGIIPGALNVPLSELSENTELPKVLSDRSRQIIGVCQGGPMGALAAHALKKRGYHNVYFMDGGTQAWLDAGYETTR